MSNHRGDSQPEYSSASGCLLRLFWMMGGNLLLAIALLQILFTAPPFFTWIDAFYWGVVALIAAARSADIWYFQQADPSGTPTNFADWWRFLILLVLLDGLAWIAAHMVAQSLPSNLRPTSALRSRLVQPN